LEFEGKNKIFSEKTQELIDIKVREILKNAYKVASEIITKNKELHQKISDVLIQKEEMLKEEFDEFFIGIA
jgi:cell division protease FtsH